MKQDRATRLRDFEQRVSWDPDGVVDLGELGRCVCVHPLADEAALLSRLGMSLEGCFVVDAYWQTRGDVVFAQLRAGHVTPGGPGHFVRRAESGYVNMVAVVPESMIDRRVLTRALEQFAAMSFDERALGVELVRVG